LIASGLKRISAKATIIQTETICQLNGDITHLLAAEKIRPKMAVVVPTG
jgi:hypothetical protein